MATYAVGLVLYTVNITANGIAMLSDLYVTPATRTFEFVFGDGIDTDRKSAVYVDHSMTEYLYDTAIVNELGREDATYEVEAGTLKWSTSWTVPAALNGEALNEIAIYDENDIMIFYGFPTTERALVTGDIYNVSLNYTPLNTSDELRASILLNVLTNTGDPDPCVYIAYGDADTANVGDETTLYSEVARALATTGLESTYTMNDTVKLFIDIDFAAAATIKEIGLFDAASTGNMAFRIVLATDEQETYAAGESARIIVKLINRLYWA